MFRVLEEYSPTLVPISIDEGFLDFTTMDRHVWRNTTPGKYVKEICQRILREIKLPVSAGLANSSRLAKLRRTRPSRLHRDSRRLGKGIFAGPSVRELSGIGKNRQRSLAALGAMTFGHVAKLPRLCYGRNLAFGASSFGCSPMASGTSRCCSRSRTALLFQQHTLPYDEPDYEAALTFTLSEATRLVGQLRASSCRPGNSR